MRIEIKKTDISEELKYNTSIIIEMLHINDLWKIQVPDIIETDVIKSVIGFQIKEGETV